MAFLLISVRTKVMATLVWRKEAAVKISPKLASDTAVKLPLYCGWPSCYPTFEIGTMIKLIDLI